MEIKIHKKNNFKVAEVVSDNVIISTEQDALDLMVNPKLSGAKKIIVNKKNIIPDFFELGTGLAGKILQKFVNYQVQLAIVGDFSNVTNESLKAFIYESNRGKHIFFLENEEVAKKILFGS